MIAHRRLRFRQPAATAFQFQGKPSGGEELGERLRRRYQRHQQSQGVAPPGGRAEAELVERLDRLLAQD